MEWWWDLMRAMDAHPGQAAWAQAFGTVLAIFASTCIAIVVPIWLRDVDRKEDARRAAASIVASAEMCLMAWEWLETAYDGTPLEAGLQKLIERKLGDAQETLKGAPPFMLGIEAALIQAHIREAALALEGTVAMLRDKQLQHQDMSNPPPMSKPDVSSILDALRDDLTSARTIRPVRVGGAWLADIPHSRSSIARVR